MQPSEDVALTSAPRGRMSCGELVYRKLFTKEDPLYLHKTFGLVCIASFLYRYAYVYPRVGNLGFEGHWFDWLTMGAHMMLSCSSLIFHVLPRRVLSRPVMIWEEYRLHAIVFTLRCILVFVVGYIATQDNWRKERMALTQFGIVMPIHALADFITSKYGTPNSTTVRVMNDHSLVTTLILRFYAFYQFLALGAHLTPSSRLMDLAFNSLIAIQSSAFLMTLVRKGLVESHTHGLVYSLCLMISGYHIFRVHHTIEFILGVLVVYAARLSFGNRVSKFWLWAAFALGEAYFRKNGGTGTNWHDGFPAGHVPFFSIGSMWK